MGEWEAQEIGTEKGISSNYRSIEWTKVRVEALHDLYEAAPLGARTLLAIRRDFESDEFNDS